MSKDNKQKIKSSAAFAFDEGNYRAVRLEDTPAGYRLAWKRSAEISDLDEFVRGTAAKEIASEDVCSVVSVDQKSLAFYNMDVPAVSKEQLDSLIRIQAESILPLSLDQMQFDYLCGEGIAGKTRVTIAAARNEQLEKYLPLIKKCKADFAVADCQGIVKVFNTLFDIPQQKYVIVNIAKSATQVLVSDHAQLAGATRIEMGSDELASLELFSPELFLHDLRAALGMFGTGKHGQTDVYVFSGNEDISANVAQALQNAGFNALTASPKISMIASDEPLTLQDFSGYLDCIAAAMLAMDSDEKKIDLFAGLLNENKVEKNRGKYFSLTASAVILAIVFFGTIYLFNNINRAELKKLENDKIDQLVAENEIRKMIAQQRPDLLELLTMINTDAPSGTVVDGISFKMGRPVTLKCQATSLEQIDKIKAYISDKKGFSNVRTPNPSFNEKTKKYSFVINFDYKHWTKKSLR